MIRALLDYAGPLVDTLSKSEGSQDLLDFSNLVRDEKLAIVPFLSPDELRAWRQNPPHGLRSDKGAIERLLKQVVRWTGGKCQATVASGPTDHSMDWKCALRDAMSDFADWRSPQIVFPSGRRSKWPNSEEIEVWLEQCDQIERSGPEFRVLVELEAYSDHCFARSDADPWDLRIWQASRPICFQRNPCVLPRPPELRFVDLDEIPANLRGICRDEKTKVYFVPSPAWDPSSISKADWRNRGPFPRGRKNGRSGWEDECGRIWHWDTTHVNPHWDVELDNGSHWNVSHTGDLS
jgi:hypothetical protein